MKKSHAIPKLSGTNKIIDTHCHLDMAAYQKDFSQILENAANHGVGHIITIGIDLESSRKAIELAIQYPQISATIGVHPHDVENIDDEVYYGLKHLHSQFRNNIVAYGEVGLDYVKNYSSIEKQKEHFKSQLELANELELPVVVHNRGADDDTLSILKAAGPFKRQGVMHCFSGDYEFARKVLDLGMYISIPGVVTFKNATTLQDVVKRLPEERIVCETDGPFLAPHPFRGKRNTPSYILFTAEKIAELRGTDIETIAKITTQNARSLFDLE